MFLINPHLFIFLCFCRVTIIKMAPYLLLAGCEVNSDPRRHGFGVPEEGIEAESKLLQIFSLDVAKRRL